VIAADTSALSAYMAGQEGADIALIADALNSGELRLPPVVVTELLSDPSASKILGPAMAEIDILPITDGYWVRAGETRRIIKAKGLKAKIADALVAQSCIDHKIALITRDMDFRHFAKYCGLTLA
jgi:predicted nucleic acid-binding protein